MRIVQLVNYYQPVLGYQEYFLAKSFQEMGHESHVVTGNFYFPYPDYKENFQKILGNRKIPPGKYEKEGITTHRLPSIELVPGSQVWLQNLSATLNRIKADLVICHNPYLLISYQIARLKQKNGFKLIYDTHAAFFNTRLTDSLIKRIYMRWFTNFAVPEIKKVSDGFFAIGESERELLELTFHLPLKSVPIIRLGVDIERFKFSITQREDIRQQLQLKPADILLIYAGKITSNKEVLVLVQALSLLSAKYKLLLLGDGPAEYLEQIRRVKSDKARLIRLNTVPNSELLKYYCAADIGIWPGDPALSMLEALVSGLPLAVAETKETAYLANVKSVNRIKRGAVKNLADIIRKIPINTEKMRVIQQDELENQFSWINKAKQLLKLLKM